MSCHKTKRSDCQDFPNNGRLAKNSNLSLSDLKKQVAKKPLEMVYCYVVKTIKTNNSVLEQKGCGPNWQGGLITLCTCKHLMRTYFDPADWKDKWIAGFTSKGNGVNGRNALVYLMQVKNAFESHYDLWNALPPKTRESKAADRNIYGDVFRPKDNLSISDKHDYTKYCKPESHVHLNKENSWQKDIRYYYNNRYAALLVGNPKMSFLWNRPCIVTRHRLTLGQKKMSVTELFETFLCKV